MGCSSPIDAWYGELNPSGKRAIVFKRKLASSRGLRTLKLPCGQCAGCRLERSRQWAMRCLHEKKLHRDNCFVTLTYDNAHLPPAGTLVKRDLQLFMKRLRKERGPGVRFYGCGEYGDLNKRPHYHVLLFNCDFGDKLQVGANRRGDKYYYSRELSELWSLGKTLLGDVTFDSAAYVARYVMKKILGNSDIAEIMRGTAYDVVDADGVVHRRLPEFTVMSRRPGIGHGYYERYGQEVRDHDSVVINGREVRPPRFYDSRSAVVDGALFDLNKEKRKRLALLLAEDNNVDRRRVKEILLLKKLKQKERQL